MSRFVKKALEKAPRIDKSQLESLLALVVAEHELYEASLEKQMGSLNYWNRRLKLQKLDLVNLPHAVGEAAALKSQVLDFGMAGLK